MNAQNPPDWCVAQRKQIKAAEQKMNSNFAALMSFPINADVGRLTYMQPDLWVSKPTGFHVVIYGDKCSDTRQLQRMGSLVLGHVALK